jgi:hypothetical protein
MPKSSQTTFNQGDTNDNKLRCRLCDKKWDGMEQRTLQKLIKLHNKLYHPTATSVGVILPTIHVLPNGQIK